MTENPSVTPEVKAFAYKLDIASELAYRRSSEIRKEKFGSSTKELTENEIQKLEAALKADPRYQKMREASANLNTQYIHKSKSFQDAVEEFRHTITNKTVGLKIDDFDEAMRLADTGEIAKLEDLVSSRYKAIVKAGMNQALPLAEKSLLLNQKCDQEFVRQFKEVHPLVKEAFGTELADKIIAIIEKSASKGNVSPESIFAQLTPEEINKLQKVKANSESQEKFSKAMVKAYENAYKPHKNEFEALYQAANNLPHEAAVAYDHLLDYKIKALATLSKRSSFEKLAALTGRHDLIAGGIAALGLAGSFLLKDKKTNAAKDAPVRTADGKTPPAPAPEKHQMSAFKTGAAIAFGSVVTLVAFNRAFGKGGSWVSQTMTKGLFKDALTEVGL